MKGHMITFRNHFHNTEHTMRVPHDGHVSKRQLARMRRNLCGVSTCCCGPKQTTAHHHSGDRALYYFASDYQGGAYLLLGDDVPVGCGD